MNTIKRKLLAFAMGVVATLGLLLVAVPSAQAQPHVCDPGEACLKTWDLRGIWTSAGVAGDYTNEAFRCIDYTGAGGCLVWGELNDRVREGTNAGCYCGPHVLSFYRDTWYGGGRIAAPIPGQTAYMPVDVAAGASSHNWQYS
ncbi:hypothetical protein FHX81_3926 [Saccharothrix saharensis]|uniref:Peptidase inhibitor family I36 n=1 Tax=Saccharothrix saharensis TaxID=571190 RepID=A0A543JFE0_9PSEU|nr:hypothetical protein [Saccharothrix saharensis]TQM81559.1 hypothetical protein FHX81_3926 [Saccharothrix saharensis]